MICVCPTVLSTLKLCYVFVLLFYLHWSYAMCLSYSFIHTEAMICVCPTVLTNQLGYTYNSSEDVIALFVASYHIVDGFDAISFHL